MVIKKTKQIFEEVLEKVKINSEEMEIINKSLEGFLKKFRENLRKSKINAEIFIGGSFAKKTMVKKRDYDIDIFLRFDQKYKEENLSKLTEKLLRGFKDVLKVHGSRDYFIIKRNENLFIELIPVLKIKKLADSRNITDLSYSHVKYLNKKIKSEKILDEIRLAKAFCYANHCYGAESYIQGFSGYGLELLIYKYQSFLKLIKAISKTKDKLIIDIEKDYKNKPEILMDLNSSKLESPIILIDPTYKQRNVLAALSQETLERFKKNCEKFLKNPSIKSFEIEKTNLEKIKKFAKEKNYEFVLMEAKTNKQKGDIAGSKLLKFYRHLNYEIDKIFEVKNKGFNYNWEQSARYFFVVKNKKEILISGPFIKDLKNLKKFKKKHKNYFIKSKRIYSKQKIQLNIKNFIEKLKEDNKLKDMSIIDLKIIEE